MKKLIMLGILLVAALFNVNMAVIAASGHNDNNVVPADEALSILLEGNKRFVASESKNIHADVATRKKLLNGQHPIAVVLCCSDSRVVPEIIFNQGLGDIFVIRVAGNIIDDDVLGSIEYGTEHLNVKLVMVLGHQNCGAVTAATHSAHAEGHIDSIVQAIEPAVISCDREHGDFVKNSILKNVELVKSGIIHSKPLLENAVKYNHVKVIGAYYNLETGEVELTDK